MIENQNGELISEALSQSERATDTQVQSSESIFTCLHFNLQNQKLKANFPLLAESTLRNNSHQPNFRCSSSLTPLSSRASSPRRRPTPRSASPTQQYSTRMSNSPRSNSVYEESPDTTLSSTAFGTLGDDGSIMKERLRSGSEEIELDYGESGDEMEVEPRRTKVDDTSEVRHAQKEEDEARSPGEFLESHNPPTN